MDADTDGPGERLNLHTWRTPSGGLKLTRYACRQIERVTTPAPRTRARSSCVGGRRRPGTRRTSRSSSSSGDSGDSSGEPAPAGRHVAQHLTRAAA